MRVELSGGSSESRNLQASGCGQPAAGCWGGAERFPRRHLEVAGSWGLLLIPIAICVVLACYASLWMR